MYRLATPRPAQGLPPARRLYGRAIQMRTSTASETSIRNPFTIMSRADSKPRTSDCGGGAPAPISRHAAATRQKALNRMRTVPVSGMLRHYLPLANRVAADDYQSESRARRVPLYMGRKDRTGQLPSAKGSRMTDVARMSFEERLGAVLERAAGKVGPEIATQLRALIEPKSLAIVAGVLIAWVVSHGFAIGEIIDFIIAVVGVFSLGLAVFSGIDELYEFGRDTYDARNEAKLDTAADHLARAIAILGIQAVLAVLFRGRPATRRANPGPPPPSTPGFRYRPTTTGTTAIGAGGGVTSWWGDIEFSTLGSATDRALVLYHEQVHQLLVPKLYFLRNVRVEMRTGSYAGSSLFRYLEETLAETVAQVRVNGWQKLFSSLRFPTRNGYVYWRRAGSDPALATWGGRGAVPEGAGLIATGFMLGVAMEIWYKPGTVPAQPDQGRSSLPPITAPSNAGGAR